MEGRGHTHKVTMRMNNSDNIWNNLFSIPTRSGNTAGTYTVRVSSSWGGGGGGGGDCKLVVR